MRLFFLIPALLLFQVSIAQIDSLSPEKKLEEKNLRLDSLNLKLLKDSMHIYRFQKLRPYIGIDNRNSFVNNQPVNFKGLQFGVILNEKHIIGLGFYAMSQNSKKPLATKEGTVSVKKTTSLN